MFPHACAQAVRQERTSGAVGSALLAASGGIAPASAATASYGWRGGSLSPPARPDLPKRCSRVIPAHYRVACVARRRCRRALRADTQSGEPAPGLPGPGIANALDRMAPATETMGRPLQAERGSAGGQYSDGGRETRLRLERACNGCGTRPTGRRVASAVRSASTRPRVFRRAHRSPGWCQGRRCAPGVAALAQSTLTALWRKRGTVRPSGCLPRYSEVRQAQTRDIAQPFRISSVCRKTPFLEFEPASAVKFDPDLTGGFRVKWTWSATFGGKRRAGGDFGAHIGDFRKYRAWRAAGSPVRAALAGFPGDVRQLFVAGT